MKKSNIAHAILNIVIIACIIVLLSFVSGCRSKKASTPDPLYKAMIVFVNGDTAIVTTYDPHIYSNGCIGWYQYDNRHEAYDYCYVRQIVWYEAITKPPN